MSELDQAWVAALAEAEARARAAGRTDISEYLALRTSNDLLRNTARDWLLKTFRNIAGEENRQGGSIQLSTDDGHRFQVDNATMVGSRLVLASGVRKIHVEVGWPRTPGDRFIRGGGLARAHVNHVGFKSASEQLRLIVDPSGSPQWIVTRKDEQYEEFHESDVRRHLSILRAHARHLTSF